VDPAKYDYCDCKQLEIERKSLAIRTAEVQGLMAKAETGVGGSVVAEVAYGNDYVTLRAQSKMAEEVWLRYKCHETPPGTDGVLPGDVTARQEKCVHGRVAQCRHSRDNPPADVALGPGMSVVPTGSIPRPLSQFGRSIPEHIWAERNLVETMRAGREDSCRLLNNHSPKGVPRNAETCAGLRQIARTSSRMSATTGPSNLSSSINRRTILPTSRSRLER
jgi:hypothetical protein